MPRVMRHTAKGWKLATYEQAERLAGFKLDRRLNYSITQDGEVEEDGVVTLPCSGCKCDTYGGCNCCGIRGAGCRECGYTGRSRIYFGFPARTPGERRRDRAGDPWNLKGGAAM